MRVLLLFRGAPGCGKSTFIREHDLEKYTLSADEIRLQLQSPMLNIEGDKEIYVRNEQDVWSRLFEMLEYRMQNDDFTVIDATNSKTSEMQRYKEFAGKYRYRIYIIDMTDLPIEECKRRNKLRPKYKQVPESAIDTMYSRFETMGIPSGFKILKPNELDRINYLPFDANEYKKVIVIGDVHGCFTALKELIIKTSCDNENVEELKNPRDLAKYLKENYLYIFLGDYLDRGIENVRVVEFLCEVYNNKNVILLEGNHESHLREYASDLNNYSRYFKNHTKPELDIGILEGRFKKSELRQVCNRLSQCAYFKYNEKYFFCCHGGISNLDDLVYTSTSQLIKGVGKYEDYNKVANSWVKHTPQDHFQISGHRNILSLPIQANERCFNLEGQVEVGGYLRSIEITDKEINLIEIKNDVFNIGSDEENKNVIVGILINHEVDMNRVVEVMRNNPYIIEKEQGGISSFNFTRDAFDKGIWNEQTMKARGLFVNNKTNQIICRGYDKFFNVNGDKRDDTKIMNLKHTLKYPVNAYVKENGFLGMISYKEDEDRLLFTTKSVIDETGNENDNVTLFKNMFYEMINEQSKQHVKDYLKQHNKTILIECVNNEKDPHIIKYNKPHLFLLDIVSNDLNTHKVDYKDLQLFAQQVGLSCKEKAKVLHNWREFYDWYVEINDENYKYQNKKFIEGFVIEDRQGKMYKIKSHYYKYWKMIRGITRGVLRRGSLKRPNKDKGSLYNAELNYYVDYLIKNREKYTHINSQDKYEINDDFNFIKCRDDFYKHMKERNN